MIHEFQKWSPRAAPNQCLLDKGGRSKSGSQSSRFKRTEFETHTLDEGVKNGAALTRGTKAGQAAARSFPERSGR